MLAHTHVFGCPCSRCSTARNYARLLAAQALRDEADAANAVAAQLIVPGSETERQDTNLVHVS